MHLDRFIGPCKVLDLTDVTEHITRSRLFDYADQIEEGDITLLKTSNSAIPATGKFSPYFVFLHASGAEYLARKKVSGVGIDYLGIEHSQSGHLTHTTLMHANIFIVEGYDWSM